MDALHRMQDGRAKEVTEQRVGEDVQERAERETWQEAPERNAEDATCNDCRHAQTRSQPACDDRGGAVTRQPAFSLIEASRRQVNVASVAVDDIAARARGDEVQDRCAEERGDFHDGQRLPELDRPLPRMDADAQHQEVTWDRDGHTCFLDQDDDEASEHAMLLEEARER